MKQFLVILMLVNVCFLSFQEAGFYLFFKLNQDYIAKNLCINQDQVELLCSGKCYLDKVVETNYENQNTSQSTIPQFDQEKVRYLNTSSMISFCSEEERLSTLFYYSSHSANPWPSGVFRPPTC